MKNQHVMMVFTGKGKGKTTAACGQALRYSGAGYKVFFIQFLKPGTSSEIEGLKKAGVKVYSGASPPLTIDLSSHALKKEVEKFFLNMVSIILKEKPDAVVFDELAYWASSEIAGKDLILKNLKEVLKIADVIVTGRNAPSWLTEAADLVTEMNEIKHYLKKGVKARKGREF